LNGYDEFAIYVVLAIALHDFGVEFTAVIA
jgi:hypothetical protein